jgi:MFS family permease
MLVSCVILALFDRRTICISSGLVSGIAAVLFGTFVYMHSINKAIISFLLLVYVAFNSYGFLALPQAMIGEILPSNIRCVGGAYIFVMNDVVLFFATKAFPSVFGAVGIHGLFWIFGVSSLLCSLFLYLMLPETKGRSLVQIEEYFLQPNILWITRNKYQNTKNTVIQDHIFSMYDTISNEPKNALTDIHYFNVQLSPSTYT